MSVLVIFLGEDRLPWLRVEDGRVVGHGDDLREADQPVIGIVPAGSVTYRTANFGDVSPAQALAAARLDAVDASLGSDRHVAMAAAGDHYVVTDKSVLQRWLTKLEVRGLEAFALIPSPSLLPVPLTGFVRAELPHEIVLRSSTTALAEDDIISPLIVGEMQIATIGQAELELAVAVAAENPPLNLLQGEFAVRADWRAATGYWRRIAVFSALFVGLTLAVPSVQWVRLSMATAALDQKSAEIAAKALGETQASDDAVERMQDALIEKRGGGAGFLATQAVVVNAIQAVPGAELASLSFDPDGTMRAMIRASSRAEGDAVQRAIEAAGLAVTQGTQASNQGRAEIEFQVRPK